MLQRSKLNAGILGKVATYTRIQRCISLYRILNRSHYDVLGITPNATQNDIKQAYYSLSKEYHPDRNEGCKFAADKFRAISEAYEVLGNYRLRRLYDKGILHTAGKQYAQSESTMASEPVEDDAQTRFYKKRMTRTHVPTASGRTPIYNFDEWARNHYAHSFERKKSAEQKFKAKSERETLINAHNTHGYVVWGVVALVVGYVIIFLQEQSYDTPKIQETKHKKSISEN
ncbi:dnaJ homolog subfamily C member 30, mitochondrial [Wyeomyia smithii]|uniref:dnaJ homolog subfamily C member 30, mitochondrial n=1 Tax=Wyeomyia smithii TaxID=174621 RepID=UPI00246814C0|nr:dnaJ homolog subfamily C member 30, mitochondrial [Wyeomyia smithii]XP_055541863.1 dnaJ homolog subfamily C member 30, mitochondrial [Wyeomyia smithii]